jgi:hypothetical protein
MSTRIESGGPSTGVTTTATASRVTPPPVRPFQEVIRAGAQVVVAGAEAAANRLPGVPILAAAVRPGQVPNHVADSALVDRPEGSAGTASEGSSSSSGTTGDASLDGFLQHQSDLNTQYLMLQERVSAENREYTAVSNILKARHDTVKNAIGNIR